MAIKPCKRGHSAERDTDGHCSECRRLRLRKDYAANKPREHARSKKYRAVKGADMNAKHRAGRLADPERYRDYGRTYRAASPERTMLRAARDRARIKSILCTITESDIRIPKRCPLLGIRLAKAKGRHADGSPSLDRINNAKGYVPGNVWVISRRANALKNDATLNEMQRLVKNWAALCV